MPFLTKETQMSNPQEGDRYTIVVAELFAKINAQRKLLKRTPIEDRAMVSRCTLRFNIDRQRKVDFSADKIIVAPEDMTVLEKMVNDQFGVYFDGELSRLCVKIEKPVVESAHVVLPSEAFDEAMMPPEKTGLVSKIKRLFGSK